MRTVQQHFAFSLVELSIVLVILGLLTGGILAGQSLIRAAELRKITTAIDQIRSAYHAFKDQYAQLPGDMNTATRFWGQLPSCPGSHDNGTSATCDGDGDGLISTGNEPTRAWQHLSKAGLLNKCHLGAYIGSSNLRTAAMGYPCDNFFVFSGSSGMHIDYHAGGGGSANSFPRDAGHWARVGTIGSSGGLENAILSVAETWNMDTKIDDGAARSGAMVVINKTHWYNFASAPGCLDATDSLYNLALGNELNKNNRGPGCQFNLRWD